MADELITLLNQSLANTRRNPMMKKSQPNLSPDFAPGSFGWHELLDRTCLYAEGFSENVAEHPAAKHPKVAKKIKVLAAGLFDLYQEIAQLS